MSAAAGAAGGAPGMSDLFSASAIVAAAAGAESDALAAAAEDTWVGGRLVQSLLVGLHNATGLPWWQDIMLCTLGMRLATLPVMIAQIKNTYRLSQVCWVLGWAVVGCGGVKCRLGWGGRGGAIDCFR